MATVDQPFDGGKPMTLLEHLLELRSRLIWCAITLVVAVLVASIVTNDVMRFLLRSEPVRMYAETEQRIHTDHEDLFTGLIKFESGAVGLLEINWLTPTKVRKLTVTGERGMYEADYLTQDLVFYANPDRELVAEGEMTRRAVTRREPLAVELAEFAAAIRAGGPPPVSPQDALVAMLLARAMVDAAARGIVIDADVLSPILA